MLETLLAPGMPGSMLALLVLVALIAGFIDAIAGGGGLLTVPAMLLAGLSPVQAIATNKLQGTFGVLSSTITFWRAGRIERNAMLPLSLGAFIGSIIGALVVSSLPTAPLRAIVPFLLLGLALYVLLSPKLDDVSRVARLGLGAFGASAGTLIGFYDGFFGPGAGTFYLMALVILCALPMVSAVAHTKLMNLASNLGALLFFLSAGHVLIVPGMAMGLAAAIGAYLGARTTLRIGAGIVRPLVVIVSIAMAIRLMLDPASPVAGWFGRLWGN